MPAVTSRRQTYFAKPGEIRNNWRIVDATGVSLGRLAVEVANVLMGKHRPEYTPHADCGDYVVVTNGKQVGLTGKKADQRLKLRYSGYPGGLKAETYGQVRERKPEKLISDAVRRMLPKSRLGRVMIARLKVVPGAEHPFAQHQPTELKV
ncbi:MAG: 50S ribosomal protein L13 [Phycisphaeraceae bacterium]|nr:50S ribosomal protein L13 [Phycisphaeraceae bacterium]